MIKPLPILLGSALLAFACSEPDSYVMTSDDGGPAHDSFLLYLTLKVDGDAPKELTPLAGRRLDAAHIQSFTASVDDAPWDRPERWIEWGEGEDEPTLRAGTRGSWMVSPPDAESLISFRTQTEPTTLGGWINLTRQVFASGEHVFRLDDVVIEDVDGKKYLVVGSFSTSFTGSEYGTHVDAAVTVAEMNPLEVAP